MAISLQKGGHLNLSKQHPGLQQVFLGLGWDIRSDGGVDFDLDASLFMLAETGHVRGDMDFIYYGQLRSPCGAIEHGGDNCTGIGDGDDEVILIDLPHVPAAIKRLVVVVTIHEAKIRGQNFGMVNSAFIRLVNRSTAAELIRFDLSEEYRAETALVFAEIYRLGESWKFKAVGQGSADDLRSLAVQYGVEVQ